MRPLYLAEPVREGLGAFLRPGGEALTARMLEVAAPGLEAVILDAGCGTGATLSYLAGRGYRRLIGIDREHALLRHTGNQVETAAADICSLPFGSGSFDLVLTECAWNLTDRKRALAEFYRVLRPGGTLAVSDIHLRVQGSEACPWPVRCCFEQADSLKGIIGRLECSGFSVCHLEEMNQLLTQAAAEFVFTHGSLDNFWRAVTGDDALAAQACAAVATTRPGLFLLIATRCEE